MILQLQRSCTGQTILPLLIHGQVPSALHVCLSSACHLLCSASASPFRDDCLTIHNTASRRIKCSELFMVRVVQQECMHAHVRQRYKLCIIIIYYYLQDVILSWCRFAAVSHKSIRSSAAKITSCCEQVETVSD